MNDNVGIFDSAIRSVLAVVLLTLAVEGIFSTTVSLVLVVVGLALWVSVSTGVCMLYKILGIDTYHHRQAH